MKKLNIIPGAIILVLSAMERTNAQPIDNDSVKFDYRKIYSFCLDGNINPVFSLVEYDGAKKIKPKDSLFKKEFENRFKYETDRSSFLKDKKSDIDSIVSIFQNYWRQSLLDTSMNADTLLWRNLNGFLSKTYSALNRDSMNIDSVNAYAKKYIGSKGMHMTDGIGKTGRLFDLLVWKTENDTIYKFKVHDEKISARVVLMDGFVTLGWEEYATLGRYYPAGWATTEALYCVRKAYDLNSEDFLISYLAHEGRHFADYKLFPKLKSPDLEYRAKLVELSLAKKTLYDLIEFFIDNANYNSDNGHSIANYCVMRDLSKAIFQVEFEKDKSKWTKVNATKINMTAYKILQANTKALQLKGPDVEKYIKE